MGTSCIVQNRNFIVKQDKYDIPYFERIVKVTGDDIKVTLGHHTFWDGNYALAFDDAFGFSYATLVEF